MATDHVTVALSVPQRLLKQPLSSEAEFLELLNAICKDKSRFLFAMSRRGNNIGYLQMLCECRPGKKEIFLLDHFREIRGDERSQAISEIEGFLRELADDPSIVFEATKSRYEPEIDVFCNGLDTPVRMELVQDGYKRKVGGWLYWYDEQDVTALLSRATACSDLSVYEDGEGLEHALAFIAAHLRLLKWAEEHDEVFVYAQYIDGFLPKRV
ncbi:hypothetical protein [Denitromonas iodatirespirans]|uniref:Uncharacterized protein n=1 Tax=Denitromonas iodatirespirans TaxID=2795389 RepID=A0A944D9V8_DENI1|nr:hypothetical protein [Denitromonas iodatirespirans]MBT0962480.1 hypothetical protein [Denitromonas iodatirespirans]